MATTQGFNPDFINIGQNFVRHFYNLMDTRDFKGLEEIYDAGAFLTFENDQRLGRAPIVEKLKSLPYQKIAHIVTTCDSQPKDDGTILVMVTGLLKSDDDKPIGFSDSFLLKPQGQSFFVTHEIFRLALHNVPT